MIFKEMLGAAVFQNEDNFGGYNNRFPNIICKFLLFLPQGNENLTSGLPFAPLISIKYWLIEVLKEDNHLLGMDVYSPPLDVMVVTVVVTVARVLCDIIFCCLETVVLTLLRGMVEMIVPALGLCGLIACVTMIFDVLVPLSVYAAAFG